MRFALTGARIFDGARFLDRHAVVVEDGRILATPPLADLANDIERRAVEGLLAPGFIDVQVNGGGGVLFNDDPSADAIRAIGAAHRRYGVTGFMPTFITDARARMAEAVAAARDALALNVPGALGVHLEGPFLNPARKGAHDPRFMRPVEEEDIALMASLGAGRTMVTLAPEMVPMETVARLAEGGVLVCAGHTEASYETVAEARRRGLRGYTHLFNAMPPPAGRAPGPAGAALDDDESWCGLIADLHHVSAPMLRVALKARGCERMMLVSDAMSLVGSERMSFSLQGREVRREGGRLLLPDGTLAGSDLDMATAVRNAVHALGVDLADALRMASLSPARFLRLDHELGRIAPGYRADLVLLDDGLAARRTWIGGAGDHA
ncbi:MAG: N-acetylglucosamine-6-phosphate deacetylase [Rhizobiales bacterium 65-9]|nr:N-acetylglucosamine-6-phosphate deacetylase [Hyphomicrobiales bacterium]OJY37914.1 MAG: N-acetylglucosamine-6-phosphate deacetylase [Rhizobiales bacterium 65-9]